MTTRHIETIAAMSGRIKGRLVYDRDCEEYRATIRKDGKVVTTYHSNDEEDARNTMYTEIEWILVPASPNGIYNRL